MCHGYRSTRCRRNDPRIEHGRCDCQIEDIESRADAPVKEWCPTPPPPPLLQIEPHVGSSSNQKKQRIGSSHDFILTIAMMLRINVKEICHELSRSVTIDLQTSLLSWTIYLVRLMD
ncbi:hypothetical protein Nepgr_017322 [Nepenthes gracilis]|uniref:Uncharacterized protein n=1 Tax=Nepenthes gracilis TaxID=150966 RepID=A0AAD3XT85_NEPGR|nr:hypothetical protein Nepgr_017322 [Nepenthes gracilis]